MSMCISMICILSLDKCILLMALSLGRITKMIPNSNNLWEIRIILSYNLNSTQWVYIHCFKHTEQLEGQLDTGLQVVSHFWKLMTVIKTEKQSMLDPNRILFLVFYFFAIAPEDHDLKKMLLILLDSLYHVRQGYLLHGIIEEETITIWLMQCLLSSNHKMNGRFLP